MRFGSLHLISSVCIIAIGSQIKSCINKESHTKWYKITDLLNWLKLYDDITQLRKHHEVYITQLGVSEKLDCLEVVTLTLIKQLRSWFEEGCVTPQSAQKIEHVANNSVELTIVKRDGCYAFTSQL